MHSTGSWNDCWNAFEGGWYLFASFGFVSLIQIFSLDNNSDAIVQVNAIDRLLTAAPNTEEFLWVLWELCALARWN